MGDHDHHHRIDPEELPLRVAERMGRLAYWLAGLDLSQRERGLMLFLIAEGGKNLDTWASQSYIGERVGMSSKTVAAAVEDLCERGLLTRKQRRNSDGSRTSDRIMLLPPPSLAVLRQNEGELARYGHDGFIDFHHGLESRYEDSSERINSRYEESADYPSSIAIRSKAKEEGSSEDSSTPPRGRPRNRRLPRLAADLFGELAA